MISPTFEKARNEAQVAEPEVVTERSGSILRVQMNRPAKKNAMTVSMYTALGELLNDADKDDEIRVVVLHGAGDSFTAGNDLGDFEKNPPKAAGSPQARFADALISFSKPLVAAVHGAAVGGGTTMLLHFDFVYAAENAKFQMPFVNLALVPELGSSYLAPAQAGYGLLATALGTAQERAEKPAGVLQASKKLLKRSSRVLAASAAKAEFQEYSTRVISADFKEAMTAFFEKRRPDFTKTKN